MEKQPDFDYLIPYLKEGHKIKNGAKITKTKKLPKIFQNRPPDGGIKITP